uniref:Uncharacterized protein n=1 Tax=Anguilla anguilla TaxID=7936 RepID=A0A0E9XVQ7_ANGAN
MPEKPAIGLTSAIFYLYPCFRRFSFCVILYET